MKGFFRSKQLLPDVYGISSEAVAKYLIVGKHHALLFDTGYGFDDLKRYVESLTSLPLYVVSSHGHIDHAGANFRFDECYMNPADMEVYKRHQSEKFRKIGWHSLNSIQKLIPFWHIMIPKGYTEADYLGNPVCDSFRPATEGMIFDLGGVTLRVAEIPGHTLGSIGLYCPERRLFFSGDGMNGGTWMFLPESAKLSVYADSIRKVMALDFDYLLTGHSTKLEPKRVLEDYLDVAEHLDFEHGKVQKENPFTPGVVYKLCHSTNTANKASLCISADKL